MSAADKLRAFWLHERGEDYVWGAEGTGGPEGEDAYDCSGGHWAALRYAGVKLPRMTANDYARRGKRIGQPSRVGDYFVFYDHDGHATHIGDYIGRGQTGEARGRAYGVKVYTVKEVNKRGAVWLRDPNYDLGKLECEAEPYVWVWVWTPTKLASERIVKLCDRLGVKSYTAKCSHGMWLTTIHVRFGFKSRIIQHYAIEWRGRANVSARPTHAGVGRIVRAWQQACEDR